jgi:hypothetical protein
MNAGLAPDGKKVFSLANGGSVLRLYECPYSWITEETMELLRMVRLTNEIGVLPLAGGTADQSYWFIEGYQIYLREFGTWQAGKMKPKSKAELKING